ncbi:MAG: NAD(P)/FAD-dependent oxidoreductase [Clostridia bacterium]|nr:NAD(P)/FAD-dependent oxidoreductase [Clostridia bacterium]MBQ5801304.1 NAD(P)/FAD-dependent oxidoreductase [Clostridia bacterium]
MFDVTIIGAGVVGGMIARELSRYDLKICIVESENDVAMGATRANSGIVHAGFDAKAGSLKAKLNVRGSEMMPKVVEELGVKYVNNGSLVIGFSEEDRSGIEELLENGNKNGVKGLRILERDELHKMEPALSKNVHIALYAPTGAIVSPYELAIAAIGNAMDNGAELKLNFKVIDVKKIENGFKIYSDDAIIESKLVINAAGAYSDAIASMVGDDSIKITPRRGEYMLLDRECGGLVSSTIFRLPTKMGKGILVSPTADGNLLLGPTSENIEDKDDKSTTIEGLKKVMTECLENVSSVPLNKVITSFVGLRSVGNTGDFIINSNVKGFINVAGIESPGLSASPAIAEYVVDMVKKETALEEKSDFNPLREASFCFREASIEEKNKMIAKDKSYGKIICRCEKITEGEILHALRANPKATDLDGVKRRTRAQTGRCQGGFCSPYIAELIAKEQGIAFDKVTKFGGESYINVGKTKGVR